MDFKTAAPDRYALLKDFAKENRQNQTLAEQVLWEQLRGKSLGVQFVRQHVVGDYIVDFVALNQYLIIEVDGGYHSELQQIEYDNNRTEELTKMGYHVIRFTNEEVMYDLDNTLETIKKELEQYE